MRWLPPLVLALVAGFAGAALWDLSGLSSRLSGGDTRAALLARPEMLTEAMAVLRQREQQARIAPLRAELESGPGGAVLGNPEGAVTLVEFSDYACGFCRQSVADIEALIAAHPDLKVVVREYPVLSEQSVAAARMALAADRQDRYPAFHQAMFRLGPPSPATIEAAARAAGVDLPRARAEIADGRIDAALQANGQLAAALGIQGTPAFVVGERVLNGAVGARAIGAAIAEAREADNSGAAPS